LLSLVDPARLFLAQQPCAGGSRALRAGKNLSTGWINQLHDDLNQAIARLGLKPGGEGWPRCGRQQPSEQYSEHQER
jgi:hypothetical protein